jgi:hypothetical protein
MPYRQPSTRYRDAFPLSRRAVRLPLVYDPRTWIVVSVVGTLVMGLLVHVGVLQ